MARRPQVSVHLDTTGVIALKEKEIGQILRAAYDIAGNGGRDMLAKTLKGSREKKILEHGMDKNPSYGAMQDMTVSEISRRVDWMIEHGYLDTVTSGRLPLICYTERGWEIVRETMVTELLKAIDRDVRLHRTDTAARLTKMPRDLILLLLDSMEVRCDISVLPFLDAWHDMEVKKVRARITEVKKKLQEKQKEKQTEKQPSPDGKIAVFFPGIGYTCDNPLLYYTRKICQAEGYTILEAPYGPLPQDAKKDREHLMETARTLLEHVDRNLQADFTGCRDILFVGKSIGTVIANEFMARRKIRVRSVCFTPLPWTFADAKGKGIVFHGSSDPWAEDTDSIRQEVKRVRQTLHIIQGANHSLETGDLMTDLQNLANVMRLTRQFILEKQA